MLEIDCILLNTNSSVHKIKLSVFPIGLSLSAAGPAPSTLCRVDTVERLTQFQLLLWSLMSAEAAFYNNFGI